MKSAIQIKLFATLSPFTPPEADHYPIEAGTTVGDIVAALGIPREKARLIFIDGVRGHWQSVLEGGERLGIFPPVGGG